MVDDILSRAARQFVTAAGWGDAAARPLAGDASFRAYVRLHRGHETAVLMLAPPDKEAVAPFVAIGRYLHSLDLSVPEILRCDEAEGLVLLEDLGDALFPAALAAGADEATLYAGATDVLVHVHARKCPALLPGLQEDFELPEFAPARLQEEVDRALDWYWPALFDQPAPVAVAAAWHAAWAPAWAFVTQCPQALTQFDFHSPNLMWLPHRTGLARIGVLDFQDAVLGPAAYDVVSLLQDPRRDLAPGLEAAMRTRYLAARPELDAAEFDAAYTILSAQRAARLLGTFVRLWRRDGKPHYLQHLPRVWRYLDASLAHPQLAGVRAWFGAHMPPDRRMLGTLAA